MHHRGLHAPEFKPNEDNLIVMSAGGFIWIIGQALATAAENPPKFALRCILPG
jgi:hypothetical protein